jgi:hypothetical protein
VEGWNWEISGMDGGRWLFLCKDWVKIMWIDCSIAIIPPFWVDVPLSSESVRLCSKMSGTEANDKVEL